MIHYAWCEVRLLWIVLINDVELELFRTEDQAKTFIREWDQSNYDYEIS